MTLRELVEAVRTGDVKADAAVTLRATDADGCKVTVKPSTIPTGDVRDAATWVDVVRHGMTTGGKGTVAGTPDGTVAMRVKDLRGDSAASFVASLLGQPAPTVKPSRKGKGDRGGVDNAVLNGTAAE